MLDFIGGLVVGSGTIYVVYRFQVIPKWKAAVISAETRVANLTLKLKNLGL